MPISLSLQLRDKLEDSQVHASGFELRTLNDAVAKAFGIPRQIVGSGSDGQLWGVINNWWGRVPDEFVTCDPVVGSHAGGVPNKWTPYADAWGEENQVKVERRAVGCHLLETTGNIDAVNTTNVRNYNDEEQPDQHVNLSYSESVEDSRYSESTFGMSLTNGIEVTVGGEFAGIKAEAKRSIEFTVSAEHTSGQSHTTTQGREVGLEATVNAAPHSIYPVSVMQGKGSLKVKIDYEYHLHGQCFALYLQKAYRGRMTAPGMDINAMLDALGKARTITDSETLNVGFVTHGDISVGKRQPLQ